jgi:hypothetical protein
MIDYRPLLEWNETVFFYDIMAVRENNRLKCMSPPTVLKNAINHGSSNSVLPSKFNSIKQ